MKNQRRTPSPRKTFSGLIVSRTRTSSHSASPSISRYQAISPKNLKVSCLTTAGAVPAARLPRPFLSPCGGGLPVRPHGRPAGQAGARRAVVRPRARVHHGLHLRDLLRKRRPQQGRETNIQSEINSFL